MGTKVEEEEQIWEKWLLSQSCLEGWLYSHSGCFLRDDIQALKRQTVHSGRGGREKRASVDSQCPLIHIPPRSIYFPNIWVACVRMPSEGWAISCHRGLREAPEHEIKHMVDVRKGTVEPCMWADRHGWKVCETGCRSVIALLVEAAIQLHNRGNHVNCG